MEQLQRISFDPLSFPSAPLHGPNSEATSEDTPVARRSLATTSRNVSLSHEKESLELSSVSAASLDSMRGGVSRRVRYRVAGKVPIALLFAITALVCIMLISALIILSMLQLLSSDVGNFMTQYGSGVMQSTSATVQRHFSQLSRTAVVLHTTTQYQDVVEAFPDATEIVQVIGTALVELGVQLLVVNGSGVGYGIASYSVFAESLFPQLTGSVVVQEFNRTATSMRMRYQQYAPPFGLGPAVVVPGIAFDVFSRPYAASFAQKLCWSGAYVGVGSFSSVLPVGGPTPSFSGESAGQFSLHRETKDLVLYLQTLTISKSGKVLLFDAITGSYVGGNIADSGSVTVAVDPVTKEVTAVRLRYAGDIEDPSVGDLIRSYGESVLLRCNVYLYDPNGRTLDNRASENRVSLSDMFSNVDLVYVAAVTDALGLNLRVILVIPSSDFLQTLRDGVIFGIELSCIVAVGLLIAASLSVHVLLIPIRDAATTLSHLLNDQVFLFGRQLLPTSAAESAAEANIEVGRDASTPTTVLQVAQMKWLQCGRQFLKEILVLETAVKTMRFELQVITSFLPISHQIALVRARQSANLLSALTPSSQHDEVPPAVHRAAPAAAVVAFSSPTICDGDPQPLGEGLQHHSAPPGDALVLHTIAFAASGGDDVALDADEVCSQSKSGLTHLLGQPTVNSGDPSSMSQSRGSRQVFSPRAAATAAFNAMYRKGTVWTAPVTYVVGDIDGFHRMQSLLLPSQLAEVHAACLKGIEAHSRECGGVLGCFFGDRFHVHFNAEKRVMKHAAAAARMAMETADALQSLPVPHSDIDRLRVRFGISTSSATCGMFGPALARSFHVMGECVGQALAICKQTKVDREWLVLMSERSAKVLTRSRLVFPRHVGLVILPYDSHVSPMSAPMLLRELLKSRIASKDGSLVSDPPKILEAFQASNAAFEAVACGEVARATRLLQNSVWRTEDHWLAGALSQQQHQLDHHDAYAADDAEERHTRYSGGGMTMTEPSAAAAVASHSLDLDSEQRKSPRALGFVDV